MHQQGGDMELTFVIYVDDRPGVLNRVASLVRRRAFNINSITVGAAEHAGTSRMTLVLNANAGAAPRIEANLRKIVHVRRVEHVTHTPSVRRDLALIKVEASVKSRSHIMQLVDVFRARVVDVAPGSLMIEATGTEDKVDGFIEILRPFRILELARTGRITMVRGQGSATAAAEMPATAPLDESIACSV